MKCLKSFFVAGLISTAAFGNDRLNDLSHLTTKQLNVHLRTDHSTITGGHPEILATFFLDHPYTNTLICEIQLSVPVVSEDGKERIIERT